MVAINSKDKTFPAQSKKPYKPYVADNPRYFKEIGFNFKTPQTAMEGNYIDKKCPFTGDITVRGRIFKGTVYKMKQEKTIVVKKNYFHYIPKYKRYERRNTKFNVHLSPCFFGLVRVGDIVSCAEVRPLSKTKKFVVVDYTQKKTMDSGFEEFKED